jgi:hypothetical protein
MHGSGSATWRALSTGLPWNPLAGPSEGIEWQESGKKLLDKS